MTETRSLHATGIGLINPELSVTSWAVIRYENNDRPLPSGELIGVSWQIPFRQFLIALLKRHQSPTFCYILALGFLCRSPLEILRQSKRNTASVPTQPVEAWVQEWLLAKISIVRTEHLPYTCQRLDTEYGQLQRTSKTQKSIIGREKIRRIISARRRVTPDNEGRVP